MSETLATVLNGTTVVSDTVEIDAPQDLVWSVLVDYAAYPEWNPYTVKVETELVVGGPIDLYLPDPDPAKNGELFRNREWVSVVDAPRHLRYDTRQEMQGIHAVRDQYVEELGPERCAYRTTDVFSGEFAQLAFDATGEWVRTGFNTAAQALKARAEGLWAADGAG